MKNPDFKTINQTYKVIEIPSEKEIIINYGSNNNASLNDTVNVLYKKYNVIDKSLNIDLGTRYIFKETLSITEIYPQFSICKKIISQHSILLEPIKGLAANQLIEQKIEVDTFNISNENDVIFAPPISIGDEVIINFNSETIG